MQRTWPLRALALALLVFLAGGGGPSALARQEVRRQNDDAFVPRDSVVTRSGPFVDVPDRVISTANQSLLALLPGQDDAPTGFTLTNQSERNAEDVAASLGGSEEALQVLQAWGWDGNVFRDFVLAEGEVPGPGGMTYLNISVHRFADAEAAASALTYFSDYAATEIGLREREAAAFDGVSRLLAGTPDGVTVAVVYVQRGQLLFRIGGTGADAAGDPVVEIVEVTRQLMASYDEAAPSPAASDLPAGVESTRADARTTLTWRAARAPGSSLSV